MIFESSLLRIFAGGFKSCERCPRIKTNRSWFKMDYFNGRVLPHASQFQIYTLNSNTTKTVKLFFTPSTNGTGGFQPPGGHRRIRQCLWNSGALPICKQSSSVAQKGISYWVIPYFWYTNIQKLLVLCHKTCVFLHLCWCVVLSVQCPFSRLWKTSCCCLGWKRHRDLWSQLTQVLWLSINVTLFFHQLGGNPSFPWGQSWRHNFS